MSISIVTALLTASYKPRRRRHKARRPAGVRARARRAGTCDVADADTGWRRPPHQVEARHPRGRPHVPRGHRQGRCRRGGLRRRRQHPESEPAASEDARSQPHGRGDRHDPRPDGSRTGADVPRRQARRRTGIAAEGVRVREGDGRRYDCRALQHGARGPRRTGGRVQRQRRGARRFDEACPCDQRARGPRQAVGSRDRHGSLGAGGRLAGRRPGSGQGQALVPEPARSLQARA